MNFLLLFIVIFSGAIFESAVLNKSASKSYPFTLLAIISSFLIFYFLNMLNFGLYLVWGISCLTVFYSIFYIIKNKNYYWYKSFFSLSTIIYAISIIALYFITKNSYVSLWDELRLWGAYPKEMFYTNSLIMGANKIIYTDMQNYPPAMQVFQYLFCKTLGNFKDNYLFWACSIFVVSLIVPLFNYKIKFNYILIPIIICVLYFLPQTYYNSIGSDSEFYYKTLFIEPALAILLAYSLFQIYKNPNKSLFDAVNFSLTLVVLSLIKESGIALVALLIIMNLALNVRFSFKNKKMHYFIFTVALPLVFYFWFKYLLSKHGVLEQSSTDIKSVFQLIYNPSGDQAGFFSDYLALLNNTNTVMLANIYSMFGMFQDITPLIAFIINAVFVLFSILIVPNNFKFRATLINLFAIIIMIVFYLGLFPVYLYKIANEGDFPSFQRYINTVYLMQLALSIFIIFKYSFTKNNKLSVILPITSLVLVFLLFPVGKANQTGNEWFRKEAEKAQANITNKMENNANKKLFLITNNDSGDDILIHHQLYYLLIENGINLDNSMFDIDWTSSPDPQMLKSELKNYDYMYLYADYYDEFVNNYKDLFDCDILVSNLYKINKTDDNIKLSIIK